MNIKILECTGLDAAWQGIKTSTTFPVIKSTVIDVSCSDPVKKNKGSSQVTCNSGTEFTHQTEPSCVYIGKFYF